MKLIDEFRRKYGDQKFRNSVLLFDALSREPDIYINGPDLLALSCGDIAEIWRRRASILDPESNDEQKNIHKNYMALVEALEASSNEECNHWDFWTSSSETFSVYVVKPSDTVAGCIPGKSIGPPPNNTLHDDA